MISSATGLWQRARSGWTALVVFTALAILHTWPLATDPAHLSRVDNADYLLNTWALSWVAHELPRHPTQVFDANIFYPERLTLAYSEAMLVQGAMAIPVRARAQQVVSDHAQRPVWVRRHHRGARLRPRTPLPLKAAHLGTR